MTDTDDNAAMNDTPVCEYLEHALVIAPGVSWESWTSIWATVDRIHKSSSFYVGDALLAGEREFGERFSQVVDAKYLEPQRGAMWVCRKIEPERRRADLSYSFHKELAGMEPEAQDRYIREAEPKCTVKRLKEMLDAEKRRSNGGPPVVEEPPPVEQEPDTFGDVEDILGDAVLPGPRDVEGASEIPPTPLRPSPGDSADEIRALIEAVRRLAPRLYPDWVLSEIIDAPEGRSIVKLTKGNQVAMGEGPSLPCALVEAALAAMLSDMGES